MYSKAYYDALKDGEARNNRIPIIIVGSDRVGKSSLRKHLLGLPFHIEEPSTNGIEVDVVELTAENAMDPWVTIAGRFFTNEEEAEEETCKSAAKQVLHEEQKDTIESNSKDDPYFLHETLTQLTSEQILKMKRALIFKKLSSEQPAVIKVFVHDFAGQSIFYDTHFCFLKMLCPYVLVVDASINLDEPAQPRFKFKSVDVERKLNDPILETNLDCFLSWLTVLERLSDFFNENQKREDLEFKLPPVVIVLTNVDRCKGNVDEAAKRIEGLLRQKAFQNVLIPHIFRIDNTSTERNGSEIRKLRGLLYELTTSILKKQPPMPVRWLKFEGVLSNMMLKERKKHISTEDARVAGKLCEIDDVDAALKFLHHQAIVVHHSESPVVVLSPPWLMNLFTEVITVPGKEIPKDAPLYDLLARKGILMQHYIQRNVDGKLLEDLMKQFSLICPWEYEGKCAYIVPSIAPLMERGEDVQELLEKSPIIPGFIHFNWSYVPLGYYTRFQIEMVKRCREDLLRIPELYCNYTLLSFRRTDGKFDVYLIKIPGIIKIGIVPREDPDPEACRAFVNFLRKTLEYCILRINDQEPLMYRNVVASLMVRCSACSWRSETCLLQHSGKVKCNRDECCHFWSLGYLQNCDEDPCCEKNNLRTITFSLDCVKFWLYKEGTVVF